MTLKMWMLDIAREQSFSLDMLREMCQMSVDAGYNALGLYLEHRFAYPSTPWSHGTGCLTPDMVATLESEFPQLQLVPFVNLLGHFEGMLYTEHGKRYREAKFQGMQACPCSAEFQELCRVLLKDTLNCFKSDLIHIGGDETWQLGQCDLCKAKVETSAQNDSVDGKAELYGEHFGPLAQWVVDQGRRPAVWGDMYLQHPTALDHMPAHTLIFDWQYFSGVAETSKTFTDRGFEVVGCPAIQTYNATWAHLTPSEENVREVTADVLNLNLNGVCVTTWECGLFGSYPSILPMILASGDLLNGKESTFASAYETISDRLGRWAELMGDGLASVGGSFAAGRIRSSLKVRLLLNANPFLAWLHHADEYCGEVGDKALRVLDEAISVAPDSTFRGISEFGMLGIQFVRHAERARAAYADGRPGDAASALAPGRQIFETLERIARGNLLNSGGSRADIERCRIAKEHVERVIKRIRDYGDGSLGYLPAFEHLTHQKFVPHDQAAWWLINRWANE